MVGIGDDTTSFGLGLTVYAVVHGSSFSIDFTPIFPRGDHEVVKLVTLFVPKGQLQA